MTSADLQWLWEPSITLLQILDRFDVPATFFHQGTWLEDFPLIGEEIISRGHAVGNHSLAHADFRELSYEEIIHELQELTRIIEESTGVRPYLFRPPFGAYNGTILQILSMEGYPSRQSGRWSPRTRMQWGIGTTPLPPPIFSGELNTTLLKTGSF